MSTPKITLKSITAIQNFWKTLVCMTSFLVNPNGDVIYSVFKEKDFGTNLLTGVYKDTGLAKAFKKSKTIGRGNVAFADFEPYEPSYNEPALFLATPLIYKGDYEGSIIFQLPRQKINKVMSF